jgi:spermidine synthase
MIPVLALAASAGAFLLAVRLVPGLDFSQGRSIVGLVVVSALVALMSLAVAVVAPRVGSGRHSIVAVAAASTVTQASLLLAIATVAGRFGLGLTVGGWPDEPGVAGVGSAVLAGIVLSVVPVTLVATGRADRLRVPAIPRPRWGPSHAVLLIFFLSGAAGLIYEVVWARQLVLVFGNTTQAVSAILTGYFGGLAIGSVVGGRIADRVRSPLRLYGTVEVLLVVIVLITPILFRSLHELYRGWYPTLQESPGGLALLRYGLALLALAPATVLMGATLPTLSRHLTRHRDELSENFGRLYAMNTTGAVIGTLLAGLVLIELFGLTATLAVGAVGSGVAGVAAIILSRETPGAAIGGVATPPTPMDPGPSVVEPERFAPSPTRNLGLVVAFVSGLTSLGYQVLWTRLFSSGSGNTTYVFTLILAIFLVGIAIGAGVFVRQLAGSERLLALLGIAQLLIAVIALLGLPFLGRVIDLPFPARVAAVVLPATLVLGLTLPMSSSLVGADEHRAGRDAGLLLGANTLGAICGTFVVPFALIPAIGSPRSVATLALINGLLGVAILARAGRLPVPRPAAVAAGVAISLVGLGAAIVPNRLVVDPGLVVFSRGQLYASAEDEIAAVQAGAAANGRKRLQVGGTAMTSLTVDARVMTLLPLMTNPDARDALIIAFGMGSSWRSALLAGLSSDGVELVPSVPAMFDYYCPDGPDIRANPRGRIIIADGRNYAELTERRYDLIVVDPPPPVHSSGTAILYSREFYLANQRLLRTGGVMMEWMPFSQSVEDFKAQVRTFVSVFPQVMLSFAPTDHGVFMLGSQQPIALEPAAIRQVLARPSVLQDLDGAEDAPVSSLDEWAAVIEHLPWLDTEGARRFGGNGPLITDDRPLPEYFLLRSMFSPPSPRMSRKTLQAALEMATP